uniref:Gamma-glutamylcyclotransferase family protein n=1 Tax=Setaria italica TaxID=4555 RepID=K4AEW0_SETIT
MAHGTNHLPPPLPQNQNHISLHPSAMGTASDAPAGAAAAEDQQQQNPNPQQQQPAKRTLVFTYGTLKRGFSNHPLLQELSQGGDASFVGAAVTAPRLPLVCGPYRVPFLINLPGEGGHRVAGELYAVTPRGLARLDELEGVSRGHYERLPIAVDLAEGGCARVDAVAYYAHRDYAAELWRRSGEKGYPEYSHAVAHGYVRRKDRPQGQTFLEQIRIFVSSQS